MLHGEDSPGRVIIDGSGYEDVFELRKLVAHEPEVGGFEAVVELTEEGLSQLLDDLCGMITAAEFRVGIQQLGNFRHGLQILRYDLPGVGPLHLDDYGLAVAENRAMHLPERGGGNRGGFEF